MCPPWERNGGPWPAWLGAGDTAWPGNHYLAAVDTVAVCLYRVPYKRFLSWMFSEMLAGGKDSLPNHCYWGPSGILALGPGLPHGFKRCLCEGTGDLR